MKGLCEGGKEKMEGGNDAIHSNLKRTKEIVLKWEIY